MAYAEVTTYGTGAYVPPIVRIARFTKTAQLDGAYFKNETGVIPVTQIVTSNATQGATSASNNWSYHSALVNNGSTAYTATSTQIVIDSYSGTTRASGNYFIYNPTTGEYMFVVKDSAPTAGGATLDVIRGCLGTSASTAANDTYLIVMNALYLPTTFVGVTQLFYIPMPSDPKATFVGVTCI